MCVFVRACLYVCVRVCFVSVCVCVWACAYVCAHVCVCYSNLPPWFAYLCILVIGDKQTIYFTPPSQLLDRAGSLYAELARFILRILLRRTASRKAQPPSPHTQPLTQQQQQQLQLQQQQQHKLSLPQGAHQHQQQQQPQQAPQGHSVPSQSIPGATHTPSSAASPPPAPSTPAVANSQGGWGGGRGGVTPATPASAQASGNVCRECPDSLVIYLYGK